MNKLILTTLVAATLLGAAVTTASAEERRMDTATYRLEEPTTPAAGAAVTASDGDAPVRVNLVPVPAPLAEMRARHADEMAGLEAALLTSRDQAARESLERQALGMKLRQQREELDWLKTQALLAGDAPYAARLDQARGELEPKAAPVATTFVPRDPVTGEALGAKEVPSE